MELCDSDNLRISQKQFFRSYLLEFFFNTVDLKFDRPNSCHSVLFIFIDRAKMIFLLQNVLKWSLYSSIDIIKASSSGIRETESCIKTYDTVYEQLGCFHSF